MKTVSEREVCTRDLSVEKIRNALGLRVEIPRFTGHDSELDIYTFREKFEKFVAPYIQRPLLPDTLKFNYLGTPAVNLVKELDNIDEIWERLTKFYGNARLLLYNKLGELSEMECLDEIRGEENLVYGISELLNAMTELSRLAAKYHLEGKLCQSRGD